MDFRVAELLRRTSLPVVLAVNKMDRWPDDMSHLDFWELGLGEPVPVSSVSGKGTGDLLDVIVRSEAERFIEQIAHVVLERFGLGLRGHRFDYRRTAK